LSVDSLKTPLFGLTSLMAVVLISFFLSTNGLNNCL